MPAEGDIAAVWEDRRGDRYDLATRFSQYTAPCELVVNGCRKLPADPIWPRCPSSIDASANVLHGICLQSSAVH